MFRKKSNDKISNGIVGVSTTAHNIAMANICGSISGDIVVKSYRCLSTDDRQEQLDALKKYVDEYQLTDCLCSYVLPIDKYTIGIIESPGIIDTDKTTVIRAATKDLIDYPIEESVVDYFPLPFKRAADNKDIAYAVITHAPVIDEVAIFIQESGLKLKYIDVQELCLRNLAMLHTVAKQSSLLLRLHANGGHIVVVSDGAIVMTRRIELALQELTVDATSIPGLQCRADELLDMLTLDLQRSIDYCSSMFRQTSTNCIMLLPSECELGSMSKILTEYLGMQVKTLNLTEMMQFNQDISTLEQAKCLLAIGAGLRVVMI